MLSTDLFSAAQYISIDHSNSDDDDVDDNNNKKAPARPPYFSSCEIFILFNKTSNGFR